MGKKAVVSHGKGPKHVKNVSIKCLQPSISFFTKQTKSQPCSELPSSSTSCVEGSAPSTSADSNVFTPTSVLQQTKVKTFTVNDDDVTSAEIIWALEVVTGKMSLNSCERSSLAFRRMFPDSKIAQNFSMGKTKAAYVINNGLAPYFRDCLHNDLKNCNDYVVCFDESLNKVAQRGQMDIVIRCWDNNKQRVITHYWNSVFSGRSTADHLLESFVEGLSLPLENLLQISMDGLNVNLSFLKKLCDRLIVDNPDGKSLLDIGVCGLHTVNGAMKTGHTAAKWDVYQLLRAMYGLFKNSPARRAKYTETTGSKAFPKKFTSVRWLENGACVDQALKIWDHVEKYVKNNPLPGNKNHQCLLDATKDPLTKAKLAAFKSVTAECEPFLKRFQSPKPLVPFLFISLQEVVRNLMGRFLKQQKLTEASTIYRLMTLDLSDNENLISPQKVDVGYGAKKFLKEAKCSAREKLQFTLDFRKLLVTMVEKLKEKSPLKSHLARGLTCFDPKVIFLQSSLGLKRVDIVLEELHSTKRVCESMAERAKKQYANLTNDAQSDRWKRIFTDFIYNDNDTVGLDEFFHSLIGNDKNFVDLWFVMKLCFIISHGNASVESGFSINKSLLVENLAEESVVAQRMIYDAVNSMGGPAEVIITRSMITSVRASRRRYHACLDKKREVLAEEHRKRNEKRKIEQELRKLEEKKKIIKLERQREDTEINDKKKNLEMKKNSH